MKPNFDNILDECIRRIENGEVFSAVLADYPDHSAELEPLLNLAQAIYELPTPQGSTMAAAVGQAQMLDKFEATSAGPAKTSFWQSWPLLLTQFSQSITSIFSKETMMFRKSFIAIALVLAILFAGTTVTAYAAQESLPGDALFGLKTTLEDIQISTAWDTADEAEKSIQYADRRVEEITELVALSRHDDIPIGVDRFEHHLEEALSALQIVAQTDPELAQQLALILTQLLDEQYQTIAALLETSPSANSTALDDALKAASAGLDDAGSVAGIDDNGNENDDDDANENDDDHGNENDDDDGNENDDDDANENDDDDANENDDDDGNENDDDDANENDDDDGNENDDDDANENDDDDGNENDDDDANENDDDDGNENDDDNGNENDDDDGNENDDDDGNENDDDNGNENDDDDANENDDDDGNENDDDNGNENDDDDGNENDDDDDDNEND